MMLHLRQDQLRVAYLTGSGEHQVQLWQISPLMLCHILMNLKWILSAFLTFQQNLLYVYLENTKANSRRQLKQRVTWLT
uniref:Uncharacterized protein n=1 Tax=Arundo donax TaxID=35708 RepID=A0A0A9D7R4_ARUDO